MRRLLVVVAVVLAACGGGEAETTSAPETDGPAATEAATQDTQPQATAAPTTEATAPSNGGSIVLTIGEETWEFPGSLCATYNAPAGEEGSEWNVSFQDGNLQVYINHDAVEDYVSITDVVDYGTFEWSAAGDAVTIVADGNEITAEGTFTDGAGDGQPTAGTLTATCASWYEG